jgi:cytochrome c biogenesis factor
MMLRFFLSIKTFLWLAGLSIVVFLAGSLYIPQNLDIFSEINEMPLFGWLNKNSDYLDKIYWIYILILLMGLMSVNMLVCTVDAIIKKTRLRGLVRVLSPQIIHISILIVLLGHGISALTGYKEDVTLKPGNLYRVRGFTIRLDDIEFFKRPDQSSTTWRIHISIDDKPHIIEVGRPSFYKGVGFFAKSAYRKRKKAIIGLVNDPGAGWEVAGAVLFVIGAVGIFYTKIGKEE